MKKRYLVTAALPYANGPLHIGHLAGAYLPADIYVRYLRLMGRDVVFVCGSDEHGAAITVKARKEGTTPQAIVDQYHTVLKDTFEKIGIGFDIYHRTSAPIHHETSQDFFRKLLENGAFLEETTEQYFDEVAGQFLADRYIVGTCPVCANPEAYGDQCEKCGSALSPTDLINPKSMLSGSVPVKRPTKHWFLRLDRQEAWLREWINTGVADGKQLHNPADWKNHVLGQCNSWLDQGLQPRAMTRDLDWGVDVPPEIPGSEGKKLYVWLDAPIGYISATKQWALDNGKEWEPYWKSEDTGLVHFIGKDNIVFHCLIFPAILKEHGDFILPCNVPANQFLNLEGRKLSTSKNWAVWVHEYCADFPGQEDVLRYNMIKKMPEQSDSEFTWKGFQETNNNELVNNLANFVNRVLVLSHKYYAGIVPAIDHDQEFKSGWETDKTGSYDQELSLLYGKLREMGAEIERFNFREALRVVMEISSAGNALLQFNEPWKTVKDQPEMVKVVLNLALQYVAVLSVAIRPFLPFSADRLRKMLNLGILRDKGDLLAILNELVEGNPIMLPNHALGQAEHLFSRIPDEVIEAQIAKLKGAVEESKSIMPVLTIDPKQYIDSIYALAQQCSKIIESKLSLGYDETKDTRLVTFIYLRENIQSYLLSEMLSGELDSSKWWEDHKIKNIDSQFIQNRKYHLREWLKSCFFISMFSEFELMIRIIEKKFDSNPPEQISRVFSNLIQRLGISSDYQNLWKILSFTRNSTHFGGIQTREDSEVEYKGQKFIFKKDHPIDFLSPENIIFLLSEGIGLMEIITTHTKVKSIAFSSHPYASIKFIPQSQAESSSVPLNEVEVENSGTYFVKYPAMKETIQYDDFAKMDIRTGKILTAEKMEKSKKLLKLSVDLGFETRTILSGIAEHFSPEEVVGKQVIVLANLAPRPMMGVESQGMILMAENEQGGLSFVSPTDGWPSGFGVR